MVRANDRYPARYDSFAQISCAEQMVGNPAVIDQVDTHAKGFSVLISESSTVLPKDVLGLHNGLVNIGGSPKGHASSPDRA